VRIQSLLRVGLVVFVTASFNSVGAAEDTYLKQSRGKNHPADIDAWRKGEERGGLKAYPPAPPGTPNPPGGLFQFGGSGATSFSGPDLGMPFAEWKRKTEE
jgi:hypothetical protein